MLELWDKVPKELREAIIALVGLLVTAATVAVKMWLSARTYKQISTNLVEAIDEGGCEVTKAASKRRNTATGIEPKVKKLIKKTVPLKLPVEGGSDETPGRPAP